MDKIYEEYLKSIQSMTIDCQMGGIDIETYVDNLRMVVEKLDNVKYEICEHDLEYKEGYWDGDGNWEEWYVEPCNKCKKCGLEVDE